MGKACLLVDYENLIYAFPTMGYSSDGILAKLRDLAAQRAQVHGHTLEAKSVFCPANYRWQRTEANAVVNCQYNRQDSTAGAKGAADTLLIFEAAELLFREGYTYFVVVSADVDYLDLANSLERKGGQCHLWPLSRRQRLRREVVDYHRTEYLDEMVPFDALAPTPVDDKLLFALCCQRLVDKGQYLGSVDTALQGLVELGVLPEERIIALWTTAWNQGWIARRNVGIEGCKFKSIQRLRYEDRELAKFFGRVDAVLEGVARLADMQKPTTTGDILRATAAPSERPEEIQQVVELLVRCGYLDRAGDRHSLAEGDLRFGTVRAAQRVVATIWSESKKKHFKGVGPRVVRGQWRSFAMPGARELSSGAIKELEGQGDRMIKKARAIGAIVPVIEKKDGKEIFYFNILFDDHPVAVAVKKNITRLVRLVSTQSRTSGKVEDSVLLGEMATDADASATFGPRESDCRFWLGMLASMGMARWTRDKASGRRTVALLPQHPLVNEILSETD